MKTHLRAIFAASALLLASLAPISARAEHNSGGGHTRTASSHDRTPSAPTHGSQSGHHRA